MGSGWRTWRCKERETLKRSRLDGSQALQLTTPPMGVYLPRWSPDGKRIAFNGKRPGKPEKIYVVSHEGGTAEQVLPGDRNEVDVNWSRDGRSLMFGRPPGRHRGSGPGEGHSHRRPADEAGVHAARFGRAFRSPLVPLMDAT